MAPSGRKPARKPAKSAKEDIDEHVYDFDEDPKRHLSGSEEDIRGVETSVKDKHERKRSSVTSHAAVEDDVGEHLIDRLCQKQMGGEIQPKIFFIHSEETFTLCWSKSNLKIPYVEFYRGEVQNMLERFGADINKALLAKRKRLEMYTKASLKTSNQKIELVWKTQQEQRQKLNQEYSQQFLNVFEQWDADIQKAEEQEEKLVNAIRHQQKVFQQARIVQSQRLKSIKHLYGQFLKGIEDMEKTHENLLAGAQNELRKEMAMLQKKIMMDTQQQEMATVRKSLQSMLF